MTECRRCSECPNEKHHWMVILAEVDEDTGDVTIPCKHCDAITPGIDCEACNDIAPQATSHFCEEDGTWLCSDCTLKDDVESIRAGGEFSRT
jgi:hypothetical protein